MPQPTTDTPAENFGWYLSAAELAATRAKVEKLNARAARKGLTGGLDVQATRVVETRDGVERIFWSTQIVGTPPSLGGWTFLAAVDTVGDDAFVVRTPPGADESLIDRSRLAAGACEHCGTSRARRYTYLVAHEDGRTLQVGKSCLQEFLGLKALPTFFFDDPDQQDFCGRGRGGHPEAGVSVRTALAWTHAAIVEFGWLSRGAARSQGRMATADQVATALFNNHSAARKLRDELHQHLDVGHQVADTVLAELPTLLQDEESEYAANLRALLSAAEVAPQHLGLLCSAITAHARATAPAAPAADLDTAKGASRVDAWQGDRGERLTVSMTVRVALRIDGFVYGSTSNLLIGDTDGGTVKMVTAAQWAYGVASGDALTITATVKEHDLYDGAKQTILTRPKLLAHDPSSPATDDKQVNA